MCVQISKTLEHRSLESWKSVYVMPQIGSNYVEIFFVVIQETAFEQNFQIILRKCMKNILFTFITVIV